MGCLLLLKQFVLLLWKNFILQIRRPVGTAFELVLPVLAVVVIIGLRFSDLFPTRDRCFLTFEPDSLDIPEGFEGPYNIYFTPNNTATNEVMHRVIERVGVRTKVMGFDNETDMVNSLAATSQSQIQTCFVHGAGIVFNSFNGTSIEYTIRLRHEVEPDNSWETARRGPAIQIPGSRVSPNFYLEEGFLHLQDAVSQSLIEYLANKSINLKVSVEQFPYPPYRVDFFLQVVGAFLPLLLVMAFLFSAGILVKELVLEKESRIRETMLMMGLKQWTLWSSWYLKQFIFFMISVIMVCILVKACLIFPRSNFLLLLIFFSIFILSMISFCFFISVWFNSARIGLIVGFVAWFVNYFPFLFIPQRYDTIPFAAKVGSCILSNTCLGLGVEVLSRLEQRLEGLQWSNIAAPLSADDDFNMAWVFGMLLIDAIGYMILSWYINGVKPGQYGVPKPFYFPCLPSYWFGTPRKSKTVENKPSLVKESNSLSNHEVMAGDLEAGISIRNLTKIYGQNVFARLFSKKNKEEKSRKKAVDNVSLEMYKGHITALLGHNGAGKTTTMSILTGLFTPTSGDALINGFNILTDMDQIRKSLGICPQHNILFDRLTVSEHLSFFMRLKGVFNKRRVHNEVKDMLVDLQLEDKANIQASRLSGGMKRKLSVAIALIGGSEVVILDEPTSGMDPYARRSTWDLLAKHKAGRTMLLTTHFMDEADLLGDRIAIMAEGKLHCSGSSLFLKSKYGVGYHMTVVKNSSFNSSQLNNVVKSLVPKAERVTDVGAEVSYVLPSSSTHAFPELFDQLEAEKNALGIVSFGVSVTTMEEVFMKVGEGLTDETINEKVHSGGAVSPAWSDNSPTRAVSNVIQNSAIVIENLESDSDDMEVQVATLDMCREELSDSPIPGQVSRPSIIDLAETVHKSDTKKAPTNKLNLKEEYLCYNFKPNSGLQLWLQQFWAMFTKRFYNSLRFYAAVVSQIFFPIVFVLFGMVLAVTGPGRDRDDPKRMLRLDNSAVFGENLSLFYVQLGNVNIENTPFTLSELESVDLGVTNIFDYTRGVQHIKSTVSNDSWNFTLNDCCSYRYQLLDQFCSSRSYQLLTKTCAEQNGFGYSHCSHCLRCCQSTTQRHNILKSCTHPLSLVFPFERFTSGGFCPSPPKLSYSSANKIDPKGPLASDNAYIAEYLLRTADVIKPDVFFRRFQAGFSLGYSEPSYSVCGCNATQDICKFITPLRPSSSHCPRYSIDQTCALRWAACYVFPQSCRTIMNHCAMFSRVFDPLGNENMSLTNCSSVQKSSTNILESCDAMIENCTSFENLYAECKESNCSAVNTLFADILQSCSLVKDYCTCNMNESYPKTECNRFNQSFCRSVQENCNLLANQSDIGNECISNCSTADWPMLVQSCVAIMDDCDILTTESDVGIECNTSLSNSSTVSGPSLDNLQQLIDCNETFPSCSTVEGLSADVLQYGACGRLSTVQSACPVQEQTTGAVYPDRVPQIEATVWYNNQPFHMPAAALNAFHNVLLKRVTGQDMFSITVNNHPLPRSNASVQIDDAATDPTGFGISVLVVFGYSFLLASFVLFLVKEKESKAKHLQFVSGVHSSSYWLATFVWDLLNALFPIAISIIIFAAFRVDAFSSPESLAAIFLLLFLTTWASIPLTYMASFVFSNSLAAFALLMIFFFFSSMLLLTVIFVLQSSGENQDLTDNLNFVFLIFPTFGLSSAFNDIYINQNLKETCQQPEIRMFCANGTVKFVDNPLEFNKPGIGLVLLYMFVEGIVFFILTLFIQNKFYLPDLKSILKTNNVDAVEPDFFKGEDSDVQAEAKRIFSGNTSDDDVVIIKNLVKVYSAHLSGCRVKPAKKAVDGICLAIPSGECFGLLGVNGAGKTTTFSILTGDFPMSSGTALIAGYNIKSHLRDVRQRIGYCPQFDALIERLTGRELLTMFARLRGVPEKQIKSVVEIEITRLDLKKYADKKCGDYSGGNKRKLSTAIALVGNPPIVLLDEPSTGMDPTTKRYLWDVLTGITKEGRSIVLTSHSMEECEALCTRLAIMVNGSFKCLGSIQHLKNKFGSGLTLQVKVRLNPPPEEAALMRTSSKRFSFRHGIRSRSETPTPVAGGVVIDNKSVTSDTPIELSGGINSPAKSTFNAYDTTSLHIFIRESFPDSVLLEKHQGAVTYQLSTAGASWSSVFRQIENNKRRLGIVDYSVSQTTLEQVFVTFAKEQCED